MKNKKPKVIKKETRANLGDIIRSEQFRFGYYKSQFNEEDYLIPQKDMIYVDGETREKPVKFRKPGTPWNKQTKYETIDLSTYDESRDQALFVVEKAQMQGGGTGHGFNDVYPDGWYIEARRLYKNRSYNPNGELISFYQSGCFSCLIPEVEVVGKMKRIFVIE